MAKRLFGRQLAGVQQLPQADAVDELHEEVVEAVGLARIIDGHDMRMAEQGHRSSLAGKPLGKGRVLADLGREDFQRHQPIELFLPGHVDHAHPAAAHQFQNFQVREMGRQLRRGWRWAIGGRPFGNAGLALQPPL